MRVTIDLMKKSTQIIDLSDVINPRVGDDDLLLPLHIVYGDNQTDMRSKDVEFLSNDTNGNRIYVAGTCNTNTPGDNLYMGNLTFRFPAGTFKADGTYDPDKTMFRIVDKATNKVISSVNVKITVMKNNIELYFDPDNTSYDSRLEDMLNGFHDKGQAMLDSIKDLNDQAKSNVSGDTAATAKEAKQQANDNAGDISDLKGEIAGARGRYVDLPGREDAQDTAINQKETIANANANYALLQQKDAQQDTAIAQKAGKFELEDKLSQISFVPETFANLAALQSTYPNGKPGLFVTADTGHKFIWANGGWSDAGSYQAVGDNLVSGEITYATPFVAPYNDLDTLPLNKIVTYATSDIKSVANIPNSINSDIKGATVYTLSNDSNLAGSVQYFIGEDNVTYSRIAWGDPARYSEWRPLGKTNLSFRASSNTVAPYDDLNTIPENVNVTYVDNFQQIKNIPNDSAVKSATVMKFGGVDGVGSVEVMTSVDTEKLYYRMTWGSSNGWKPWNTVADGNFYLPGKMTGIHTGAPYDDLNTFPTGQTVTIAETPDTIGQIKNLPPISNTAGGLTVRTESSFDNSNIGGIQIAIDTNNVMYHRICWGASGRWGAWRSDSVDEHINNMILPTLSLFQKVGVVGDSYASGELAFDGKFVDHYEISWLQILARKDGFTGTNFSMGGMSTRTWLTNPKCMPLMQSSDAQDLYILALGINDEALGVSYIGSEADIDNGADTFYGNYGKIIKAIQTKAPQAKIVIATIADSSDLAAKFNEAITTIANHFTIPVIVQLDDPLFNSSFYKDNMIGGHPTGPVYSSMAEAFERLIGQSMMDHLDYYKTFKKDA